VKLRLFYQARIDSQSKLAAFLAGVSTANPETWGVGSQSGGLEESLEVLGLRKMRLNLSRKVCPKVS
jgi:hypothetical protein